MKNNRRAIWIISLGVIILIGIGYYIYKNNTRYNWYENYSATSNEPYATKVMAELMKSYYPGTAFHKIESPLAKELEELDSARSYNYVFIGGSYYTDSVSTQRLVDFVKKGNQALIASSHFGYDFLNQLFVDSCYEDDEIYISKEMHSLYSFNFYNSAIKKEPNYHFQYVFRNEPYTYNWRYFDSLFFCHNKYDYEALGYQFNKQFNFIRVHVGKGNFYLHSTPILFTNYALLKKDNRDYAEKVFSYLPRANVLWDEVTKSGNMSDYNPDLNVSKSPLQFILSEQSLRWAWYILLFSTLLYMVFFSRRRQRIIPVLPTNNNTSLEYVQTIGLLYLQQQDNRVICRHKMRLLQLFIRNRYSINTNKIDDLIFERLAAKSTVPVGEIKDIFTDYKWIEDTYEVDNNLLMQFYSKIENFYKKCK